MEHDRYFNGVSVGPSATRPHRGLRDRPRSSSRPILLWLCWTMLGTHNWAAMAQIPRRRRWTAWRMTACDMPISIWHRYVLRPVHASWRVETITVSVTNPIFYAYADFSSVSYRTLFW